MANKKLGFIPLYRSIKNLLNILRLVKNIHIKKNKLLISNSIEINDYIDNNQSSVRII